MQSDTRQYVMSRFWLIDEGQALGQAIRDFQASVTLVHTVEHFDTSIPAAPTRLQTHWGMYLSLQ